MAKNTQIIDSNQTQKIIYMLVSSDLASDQRVLKVANSCHKHNNEVHLVGRLLPFSAPLQQPFQCERKKLKFNQSFLFYAEMNIRFFWMLMRHKFDIVIANDTDTLPAAWFASLLKRKILLFDAHELFPEVPELQDRPRVKAFWQSVENFIFPMLKNSYTVCDSIAKHYQNKYGIQMQVVRNMPYFRLPHEKILNYSPDRIILYQGALNVGRGLEWVIDAMPMVEKAVLVIIGDGDIRKQLEERVRNAGLAGRVYFMGRVSGTELFRYTSSADIGLCLLEKRGLSYYYALPNRIFDYIQSGVPVLATGFPEMKNIVQKHRTGLLTNSTEPTEIAKLLNRMLTEPQSVAHFPELAKQFCWENEEKVLLDIIRKAER